MFTNERNQCKNVSIFRLGQFAEISEEESKETEFSVPEDLTELSDEGIAELEGQAREVFDALYGDGTGLSDDDLVTLAELTEAIEQIDVEMGVRQEKAQEREAKAKALADRARKPEEDDSDSDEDTEALATEDEEDEEEEEDPEAEAEVVPDSEIEEPAAASVQASGKRKFRVPLPKARAHRPTPKTREAEMGIKDVLKVADVPGFRAGTGTDWHGAGEALDQRLAGFNRGAYEAAARQGRHLSERQSVAMIHREFPEELRVSGRDPEHIEQVIANAVDQNRLPGNSLVASGTGWCAPSTIVYDFLEPETTDGLLSAPEIGISRGGIQWTTGVDFSDIWSAIDTFEFTEAQDIEGEYNDGAVGDKPFYKVDCPDFQEARLQVAGYAIEAGILQSRGFPEIIARTLRGAAVVHAHKMAGRKIGAIQSGSDAVTMPSKEGSVAPVLESIELQVEHYRYVHRLSSTATLEAVFPRWVLGALRSDLSRRLGVDMIDVPNARIVSWFTARGVVPQFVYNYQDITGDASAFTAWPGEVKFLLYLAGTWVFGASDVITLDTIYDSVYLKQNDYVALFTEEGWLGMKRFTDSREVTVPLCPTGHTGAGVLLDCDGSAADPEDG